MANNKNDKVISVRLSSKEVERLEGISKQWDISVSSLVRSFISSCLYSLPSDVPKWIKSVKTKQVEENKTDKQRLQNIESEPEVIEVPQVYQDAFSEDTDDVKAFNNTDSKAENDIKRKNKANPMKNLPKISRNAPCPCGAKYPDGRPKKYKHCCGK